MLVLRFNELAFLRCCDVRFCDGKYVELFIAKSKTDIYRNGNVVVPAKTGHITYLFSLLSRYVQVTNIDVSSTLKFFRTLHFLRLLLLPMQAVVDDDQTKLRTVMLRTI